jgi:hypothetical protein
MAEISTGQMGYRTVKVKNTRTDAVVDAMVESYARDGSQLVVIIAKNKVVMKPIPGKRGQFVANMGGMELTANYP